MKVHGNIDVDGRVHDASAMAAGIAEQQAIQIVSLDEDIHDAKVAAQARKMLDGRGPVEKSATRKRREIERGW